MVYLRELLKHNKDKLLENKNIETVAYLYISSPQTLTNYEFDLTPEEEISLKGYKGVMLEREQVSSIISKPPIKGISATTNIYKFSGLYLAAKEDLHKLLQDKYSQSDLKQKYFLSKIEASLKDQLLKDIKSDNTDSIAVLIKKILKPESIIKNELDNALKNIAQITIDVQNQIILEDLEETLLITKYNDKTAEEIVRDILNNFGNAIQKIIKNRRSDHSNFLIKDEYDVQDILYVILKSIFPKLREEDPIPKVGAKSSKIDLILREEKILIEVKMIKANDSNEIKFIDQLKIDFESYHECKWLDKLFCFVYDPYKKTKDIISFKDLNGNRAKGSHNFNVEIIVVN